MAVARHLMTALVMKTFPSLDFRLLRLKHQTKGASETVGLPPLERNCCVCVDERLIWLKLYMTTQSMGAEYMGRRTVSLDCKSPLPSSEYEQANLQYLSRRHNLLGRYPPARKRHAHPIRRSILLLRRRNQPHLLLHQDRRLRPSHNRYPREESHLQ